MKFADSADYSANVPFSFGGGYNHMPKYDCFWDSLQSAPIGHRTYLLEGGYYLTYNCQFGGYEVPAGYYTLTWSEFRKGMLETFKEYPNTSGVGIHGEEILVTDPFEEVYICEDTSTYAYATVNCVFSQSPSDLDDLPAPTWGNLSVLPLEYPITEEQCQFFCDYYRTPDPEMIEKLNDIIRKGELEKTFKRYK